MIYQRHRIFIFFIIYFQYACGKTESNDGEDSEPNLKDLITAHRTEQFFKEQSRRNIDFNKIGKSFLGKSRLVQRVIPHGYRAGPYEYDSLLNTVYKPLIRFHVKKNNKKKTITVEDILREAMEVPKTVGYLFVVNEEDRHKDQLKEQLNSILFGKTDTDASVLKSIARHNHHHYHGKKIARHNTHQLALALGDKTSVEDSMLLPGQIPLWDSSVENPPTPVKIPIYPFWNGWTYQKTIHEDECEGNLVKLGEMCIAPSGHRRHQMRP